MSLFRRANNTRIHFYCVELYGNELKEIAQLIEKHGGVMTNNCLSPILFIKASRYTSGMHSTCRLYNINFIKDCANAGKILNLNSYRLNRKKSGERCALSIYLFGDCYYKNILRKIMSQGDNVAVPPVLSDSSSSENITTEDEQFESHKNEKDLLCQPNSKNDLKPNHERFISPNIQTPLLMLSGQNHSADTESFETAYDYVRIKSEEPESQDWHVVPIKKEDPESQDWHAVPNTQECQASEKSNLSHDTTILSIADIDNCDASNSSQLQNGNQSLDPLRISPPPNQTLHVQQSLDSQNSPNSSGVQLTSTALRQTNNKPSSIKIISEARNCSPTPTKKPTNQISWIAPDDNWLRNDKTKKPAHHTNDYIDSNNGKVPLLRLSPKSANNPKTSLMTLPKPCNRQQTNASRAVIKKHSLIEDSSSSDDSGKKVTTKKTGKVRKSTSEWDKPGPSGLQSTRPTVVQESSTDSDQTFESRMIVPDEQDSNTKSDDSLEGSKQMLMSSPRNEKTRKPSTMDRKHKENNKNGEEFISDSSDECVDISDKRKKKREAYYENSKRKRAVTYAQNWRSRLNDGRPENMNATYMAFTRSEQKSILSFLCSHENIEYLQPKGFKIWKEMIDHGILPHRTAQSLQNHFVKHLLPNIQDYFDYMRPEHIHQFKRLQTASRR